MTTAQVTANPATGSTISAEPWSQELAEWHMLRGLDPEPCPRVVVRRERWIHAVLPPTGPPEALSHIARRVARTWSARYVERPGGVA